MRTDEWLYTNTTYGPAHDEYVADLYWDLIRSLETSFLLQSSLDHSQRFSRLANILFKHSAVFHPYR